MPFAGFLFLSQFKFFMFVPITWTVVLATSWCWIYCLYFHRENKNLTGTARYASCNTHLGIGKILLYVCFLSLRLDTVLKYSLFKISRAKSEGWSGISWLRSFIFLERQVWPLLLRTISYLQLLIFLWFVFLFFSFIDIINWLTFSCSLPWQGLKADTKKQKYDKIREKKVSTTIEVCFRKLDGYVPLFFNLRAPGTDSPSAYYIAPV